MDRRQIDFIEAVLGPDGAQALAKAIGRAPKLGSVLLPRAIVAWLQAVGKIGHAGPLPGVEDSFLEFRKADRGFTGLVGVGQDTFSFESQTLYHVAANVALLLGLEAFSADPRLHDLDLAKLGKSVDTLAKARVVSGALQLAKRQLDPALGYKFSHVHKDLGGGRKLTEVNVHAPTGEHVGTANFAHEGQGIVPGFVVVDDAHQRRGIASAMLAHAQQQTGKRVVPAKVQTPEGDAFFHTVFHPGQQSAVPQGIGKAEWRPGDQVRVRGWPHSVTVISHEVGEGLKDKKVIRIRHDRGEHAGKHASVLPEDIEKVEAPGQTAQPRPQLAPTPPQGPVPPKVGAQRARVTKSQAERPCGMCGRPQFEGPHFRGCLCFVALAKQATAEPTAVGYAISFGPDWDQDAVSLLLQAMQDPDPQS